MKKFSILLLIFAICLLTVTIKADDEVAADTPADPPAEETPAEETSSEEVTSSEPPAEDESAEDDDDDNSELEGGATDSLDEEWETVLKTTLADAAKMHTKEEVLDLAYQHLIYEELDNLKELRTKHENKTKLDDEEAASLSNAVVVKSYIDAQFGERTEMPNQEVIDILNSEKYDNWMDDMPDSVINQLDEFMPDEEEDEDM